MLASGRAPACCEISLPLLKKNRAGMPRMFRLVAAFGYCSEFSFRKRTLPLNLVADAA